jgi:fluoride ion exporter CrcB/FEX
MVGDNQGSTRDVACIIVGSGLGAVIRYVMFQAWPAPTHLFTATLISGISGFALVGFVLASRAGPEIRAFVAGICGAITSVSVYIAVGINQPPWTAIALITLTPVSMVTGIIIGALLGLSVTSRRSPRVHYDD